MLGKTWDVEKGYQIVKEMNIPPEEFAVSDLASLLGFVKVNKDYAMGNSNNAPVLLIVYNGSLMMIDGYHRVYKAKESGVETMKGYVLEEEQAKAIEI